MVNAYLVNVFMITAMVGIVVDIVSFIVRKISNIINRTQYRNREREDRLNHLFSKCDYIREEQHKDYVALYTRCSELKEAIEVLKEKINKKENEKNVKKKKRN